MPLRPPPTAEASVACCPVCAGPSRLRQSCGPYALLWCGLCDLAFIHPPMTREHHRCFHGEQFFRRFYQESIEDFYAHQGPLYRRERVKKTWMLDYLTRFVRSGDLLDVGAGQAMVDYLARERGFRVSLVEICPPVVEYHRSQGLQVYEGYLEEAGVPCLSMDAVTFWHSLEHVFDALATLREVARILRPGGYLVGALPNWRGLGTQLRLALGHRLFEPETDHELHFFHFSRRALVRAFLRAGLEPVEVGRELHRPRRLLDQAVSRAGEALSLLPGVEATETMTFVARKPAGLSELPPRSFVRWRSDAVPGGVRCTRLWGVERPRASVVIPTLGRERSDTLDPLLRQLRRQTLALETLLVEGDVRQGRAINCAVDLARAPIVVTLDDDTSVPDRTSLETLVAAMESDPSIGMAGGSNQVPEGAPWLVRRVMLEVPRRSTPPVSQVTDSDLAEHPCLAIRTDLFRQVGGENEWMPRGLDPYLREQVRRAGSRVVVVPGVVYSHLAPARWGALLRQFFRNGRQSRYCAQYFPEWLIETLDVHGSTAPGRRSLVERGWGLLGEGLGLLAQGHPVGLACRLAYAMGWLWEAAHPTV